MKQRKYTNHKIFVSEKQYPKRCFLLRKLLRNIPYLSKGVSQSRIPNSWFLLRKLLGEHILLTVEESSSHGTAPTYCQSPQEP
jgi:hypothetical protein